MVTFAEILTGIETRLKTIDGLRVEDYVPGQVNPPAAFVGVPPVEDYHQAMGGRSLDVHPTITVLVSSVIDRAGQLLLAEYANPTGARSIPAAIEADRGLGGIGCDCTVTSFEPQGLQAFGELQFFTAVFTLHVIS